MSENAVRRQSSHHTQILVKSKVGLKTTSLYVGAALAMAALLGAVASGVEFVEMATGG